MINYAALIVDALHGLQTIIKDLESGHITLEQAQARIAALKSDRAAGDAEADAAAREKFTPANKVGI